MSREAKGGRRESNELAEAHEILDFWRFSNLLALWSRHEWQSRNVAQTIRKKDSRYYIGLLFELGKHAAGDAPLAVVQVAFCDVAMAGRQRRGRPPKKQSERLGVKLASINQKEKRLSALFKKCHFPDNDVRLALENFRCDPSNLCWDAYLADSDSYTYTDPYGDKSNELPTIMKLKTGGVATHRIFPRILRRMATYWRKHPAYKTVVAYFENVQQHGLPDNIEVSQEMVSRTLLTMRLRMTELQVKLYESRQRSSPSAPRSSQSPA